MKKKRSGNEIGPRSTTGRLRNLPSCMVWSASKIGMSTVPHSGFVVMTLKKAHHFLNINQAAHDIYNQCSQLYRTITNIVFVYISLLFVVFSVGVAFIFFPFLS
jgi:hypothetical protein